MTYQRANGTWRGILACGVFAGAVINVVEWTAHRIWLNAQWNAAFAALGKVPSFWGTFVGANFGVGVVALWSYRWLSNIYGRSLPTALKTAGAMWVIFWVIPIMGLQPFDIFPNYLLALVIAVGIADAAVGILPAIALFERLSEIRAEDGP